MPLAYKKKEDMLIESVKKQPSLWQTALVSVEREQDKGMLQDTAQESDGTIMQA